MRSVAVVDVVEEPPAEDDGAVGDRLGEPLLQLLEHIPVGEDPVEVGQQDDERPIWGMDPVDGCHGLIDLGAVARTIGVDGHADGDHHRPDLLELIGAQAGCGRARLERLVVQAKIIHMGQGAGKYVHDGLLMVYGTILFNHNYEYFTRV